MGERLYYYSRGLPLRCVVVAHDDGAAVVAVMKLVTAGQRGMLTSWVIEWKRLSVWFRVAVLVPLAEDGRGGDGMMVPSRQGGTAGL